jgi:hypothetical protein
MVHNKGILTLAELRFLDELGFIKRRGEVVLIDEAKVSTAVANLLHSQSLVTTTEELTEKGRSLYFLGTVLFELANEVYDQDRRPLPDLGLDAGRVFLHSVVRRVTSTRPSSGVQKVLKELHPETWLINPKIVRRDEVDGQVVMRPAEPVFAVTNDEALLQAYETGPQTVRSVNAIRATSKRGALLIERVPSTALQVVASLQVAAATYALEAQTAYDVHTAKMPADKKADFDAKLRPVVAALTEVAQPRLAIEAAPDDEGDEPESDNANVTS